MGRRVGLRVGELVGTLQFMIDLMSRWVIIRIVRVHFGCMVSKEERYYTHRVGGRVVGARVGTRLSTVR